MNYTNEAKNNFIKQVFEARTQLLVNKNHQKAIEQLLKLVAMKNEPNIEFAQESLAMAYFENKEYALAASIYKGLGEKYQEGFCELLQGNEKEARSCWLNAKPSEAIAWGRCLINLIKLDVEQIPSFIQIRNHLEADITYFIKAGKLDYASSIIQLADFFEDINLESYKFIGKALMAGGYSQLAINYFNKAKDVIPQDSENYYHIAQYFIINKSYKEAQKMLSECLEINKYYTPASQLLEYLKGKF